MSTIAKEIQDAIDEIKKTAKTKELTEEQVSILLLASLIEEEG